VDKSHVIMEGHACLGTSNDALDLRGHMRPDVDLYHQQV